MYMHIIECNWTSYTPLIDRKKNQSKQKNTEVI